MRYFFLMLVLAVLPAAAADFSLKGITLGEASSADLVREKFGVVCGAGAGDTQVCNGRTTLGREPVGMNLVIGVAGTTQRMMFVVPPAAFDVLAAELEAKFGPPQGRQTSVVQNAMGAKYQQEHLHWENDRGEHVDYMKYSNRLTESMLVLHTKEDRDLIQKPKANRRGDL